MLASPPVIAPCVDGAFDVAFLRILVAAAEQHDDHATLPREIHAVSGADVDAQFAHALAAVPAVAEVRKLEALDAPQDGDTPSKSRSPSNQRW